MEAGRTDQWSRVQWMSSSVCDRTAFQHSCSHDTDWDNVRHFDGSLFKKQDYNWHQRNVSTVVFVIVILTSAIFSFETNAQALYILFFLFRSFPDIERQAQEHIFRVWCWEINNWSFEPFEFRDWACFLEMPSDPISIGFFLDFERRGSTSESELCCLNHS